MENKFIRAFDQFDIIKKTNRDLFHKLLEDAKEGKIFPAIRNQYIDFYVNGYRMFEFNNSFKINRKIYAKGTNKCVENGMITEKTFKDTFGNDKSFTNVYDDMKQKCKKYGSQKERAYSDRFYPVFKEIQKENVILLDREIVINPEDSKRKADWLLYHVKQKKLRFVEVKLFGNKDVYSKDANNEPKVYEQVKHYTDQYEDNQSNIEQVYITYIGLMNKLFKFNIPQPDKLTLDTNCGLVIFESETDEEIRNCKSPKHREAYESSLSFLSKNMGDHFLRVMKGQDIKAEHMLEHIWDHMGRR